MIGIADKLRALDIIRWNMVPTQRQQSLAEHTFMVAMIAEQIANELGLSSSPHRVIKMALYHDLEEVMTGDIPAPTKQKLKSEFGSMTQIFNSLGYWDEGATLCDIAVVKAADYIADMIFLKRYGHTPYADLVLNRLAVKFTEFLSTASDSVHDAALKTLAMCANDKMNLP